MSLVFIVADSLRSDALGCMGGAARTPTADALSGRAVLFEQAFSAAPWTVPSVASMLTGVYSHRLGVVKWEQPWPKERDNLFERAAGSGFTVASFVFDPGHLFKAVPSAHTAGSSQDTAKLIAWLRRHKKTQFVVFIHYWWTHIPYVDRPMTALAWKQASDQVLAAMRRSEAARAGVKRLYHRAVERFSEVWLPQVLDALDLDSTWVVLTADHGESWGERAETAGLRDVFDLHGNHLYNEVLRVPLILRPPGGCAPRRIASLVRTVDLLPTLTDLLEIAPHRDPGSMDGISLAGSILHGEPLPQLDAISAMNLDVVDAPNLPTLPHDLWTGLSLVTAEHKLIWRPKTQTRVVFDLKADPGETADLWPRAMNKFEAGFCRLQSELERAAVAPMAGDDTAVVQKRLDALGYL